MNSTEWTTRINEFWYDIYEPADYIMEQHNPTLHNALPSIYGCDKKFKNLNDFYNAEKKPNFIIR